MDVFTCEQYYQAITVIEAQDMLINMQIADYPMMKKEDKRKLHKQVHKKAYPDTTAKAMTAEDVASQLQGL